MLQPISEITTLRVWFITCQGGASQHRYLEETFERHIMCLTTGVLQAEAAGNADAGGCEPGRGPGVTRAPERQRERRRQVLGFWVWVLGLRVRLKWTYQQLELSLVYV